MECDLGCDLALFSIVGGAWLLTVFSCLLIMIIWDKMEQRRKHDNRKKM